MRSMYKLNSSMSGRPLLAPDFLSIYSASTFLSDYGANQLASVGLSKMSKEIYGFVTGLMRWRLSNIKYYME